MRALLCVVKTKEMIAVFSAREKEGLFFGPPTDERENTHTAAAVTSSIVYTTGATFAGAYYGPASA